MNRNEFFNVSIHVPGIKPQQKAWFKKQMYKRAIELINEVRRRNERKKLGER